HRSPSSDRSSATSVSREASESTEGISRLYDRSDCHQGEQMPAYTSKDIARAFRGVRAHTIQIANEIPEDKYGASGAPGTRTVAQLLTHIALAPRFQRAIHGRSRESLATFDFQNLVRELAAEEAKPRTKADIIAFLKKEG